MNPKKIGLAFVAGLCVALLIAATSGGLMGVQLYGLNDNGAATVIRVDGDSEAILNTTFEQHSLFVGETFFVSEVVTLADTGTRDYLIETGTNDIHFRFEIGGKYDTEISLYEDSGRVTGTSMVEQPHNRAIGGTPDTVITHTPAAGTGDGTLFYNKRAGDSTTPSGTGGTSASLVALRQLILKPSAKYLLRVTSHTDDNVVSIYIFWDEHHEH